MRKKMEFKFFTITGVLSLILAFILGGVGVFAQEEEADVLDKNLEIIASDDSKTAEVITGELSNEPVESSRDAAEFLSKKKYLINREKISIVGDKTKYVPESKNVDEYGNTHYRTNLIVDNLPVYGAEMIVHTNKEGDVYAINGKTKVSIPSFNWNKRFKKTQEEAIQVVLNDLEIDVNKTEFTAEPKADKFIYEFKEEFYSAYIVDVNYIAPEAGSWIYFINAESGEIIDKYNNMKDAYSSLTGRGIDAGGETVDINISEENNEYYLIDSSIPSGTKIKVYDLNHDSNYYRKGNLIKDRDRIFDEESQRAGVSALINSKKVYEYYLDNLKRNSVDGKGMDLDMIVHYGNKVDNAFWLGDRMIFGDGSGGRYGFKPLSVALDVVAHEMTHGVTQNTSKLEYRNQSGAINEAMSDIMGVACENYYEGEKADWLVGEDLYSVKGDYLRSLEDPTEKNYPDNMGKYQNVGYDYGGVHINSNIINKAAYNIGNVIGMDSMGKLFYHTNANYLTRKSDFNDLREALLLAASDKYQKNSKEYNIVMDAFAGVGIGEYSQKNDNTQPKEKKNDNKQSKKKKK